MEELKTDRIRILKYKEAVINLASRIQKDKLSKIIITVIVYIVIVVVKKMSVGLLNKNYSHTYKNKMHLKYSNTKNLK